MSLIFLMVVGVVWLGVGVLCFQAGRPRPFILHLRPFASLAFVFHFYSALGLGQDFDLAIQLVDWLAFIGSLRFSSIFACGIRSEARSR